MVFNLMVKKLNVFLIHFHLFVANGCHSTCQSVQVFTVGHNPWPDDDLHLEKNLKSLC